MGYNGFAHWLEYRRRGGERYSAQVWHNGTEWRVRIKYPTRDGRWGSYESGGATVEQAAAAVMSDVDRAHGRT